MQITKGNIILLNANVITMSEELPYVSAVVVSDGRIKYVGTDDKALTFKTNETTVLDLKGKTVMPGIIESHTHPLMYGMNLLEFDCRAVNMNSIEEMQEKLRSHVSKYSTEEWIRGWGWDDTKLKEKRRPTRWDLDKVAPFHPVVLKRTCGHICVLNSKALELCNIDKNTPDPEGGKIVKDPNSNEPTGILEERARELVPNAEYNMEDAKKAMILAQKDFAKWGITTVHDAGIWSAFQYQVYQELLNDKNLDVRFRLWFWAIQQSDRFGFLDSMVNLGVKSGFGNELLNIQGTKFMLDGGIGGKTAALFEPYEGTSNSYGILHRTKEEIKSHMKKSLEADLRIAIHAIGDKAIDIAIDVFDEVGTNIDIKKMRNRIEHCIIPTDKHIEKMKEIGLIAGSSVGFLYHLGNSFYKNLGKERIKRAFPHKKFIEHGIVAPGNSDLPVTNGNPFEGVYSLVNRKTHSGMEIDIEQKISVYDALKAYTIDAAYSSCEENLIGSIKEEMYGDLIVLSENPLEISVEELKSIKVETTIMNGNIIYSK